MTTVAQLLETAKRAVRSFSDFFKANADAIASLPNADEMARVRLELLRAIVETSAELETALASPDSQASPALVSNVTDLINTLRARRAEIEHYLGESRPASGSASRGLLLVGLLGVTIGLVYVSQSERGSLGALTGCGCG